MTVGEASTRISAMRKIWGERDARACVKAAKAAGLGLGAWAREHGVDGRSLHAGAVNLGLVVLRSAPVDGIRGSLIDGHRAGAA